MPGPPPPPPMAPPPPTMAFTTSKGGADDRSALLKSIQKGAKLKKAVTNDKSGPMIMGKVSNNNINNSLSPSPPGGGGGLSNQVAPSPTNGLKLGGLFAGGMPKLRPTGKLGVSSNLNNSISSNNNNNNNHSSSTNNLKNKKPDVPPQSIRNLSSVQDALKKQMASDNKNRGPPPPAPIRNVPDELNGLTRQQGFASKNDSSSNGVQNSMHPNLRNIQQNISTLHRKAKSNANLTTLDSPDSVVNGFSQGNNIKPVVINHGKPNLAPKPPVLNGKVMTPPKKLSLNGKMVSRAQSMRSPRSPSPQQQQQHNSGNMAIKFGTVSQLSSVIGQSLAQSTGSLSPRPRPPLNGRPSAPPPSIPLSLPPVQQQNSAPPPPLPSPHTNYSINQIPLPPSKTWGGSSGIVKPPNHAPPPPPGIINGSLPQPPSHAPPRPPHRTPIRPPPAIPAANNNNNSSSNICNNNNLNAPPPPPRHSSMRELVTTPRRNIVDLDEKYKHMFHNSSMFPRPPPYRHVLKLYPNKQAGSKQQAPQPPNLQSTSNKTWNNAPTAC